jgi:hypothetical protein
VISIKDPKTQKLIDEILQRTKYSTPLEYLEARIKSDFETVIKNKKLL